MTPRPCIGCGVLTELPAVGPRCIWCRVRQAPQHLGGIQRRVDEVLHVLTIGARMRRAFAGGDQVEHARLFGLLRHALRVVDESVDL